MKTKITIPDEPLQAFCRRWQIAELALFGSALREDFSEDSDIDVLVRFHPNAGHSLFDLVVMEDELSALFGRKVDLVTRNAIENSPNYLRRDLILDTAEVIYAL